MALAPGDRLGPFDIIALIGEGGMGQVYRARDAKLARDVAIKVLPEAFASDPDRLARFRREAQALASLNDQHIAQIYHLEESAPSEGSRHKGQAALVMEFVEGRTLAELLHGRGLDVQDALQYAAEIASGLETAHEKGIVHRDLKPANVKITPEGHAKILDFGLAKAMGAPGTDDPSLQLANSPTLTARATEAGMILGTAAYMSPEQARGKAVDKRTDIWAFGCVLFEMLTGHRAFEGDTVSDTLASVLRSDPNWSLLPASLPSHVRALLLRCLERDVTRRLRDIGEARLLLAGGAAGSSATSTIQMPSTPLSVADAGARPRPWPWIAAVALLLIALAAIFPTSSLLRKDPGVSSSAESFELAIAAPPGGEFQVGSNSGNVILSPDGSRIAFVAATDKAPMIWIRSLATDDARSIPGTENAFNPFWAPDGRSLGFFASGRLWTVKIAGGLPEAIATSSIGRGGAWNEDGVIIFAQGGTALSRVAATGGAVSPQTTLDLARGENAHYWPVFLPGGKRFIYFVRSTQVENGGIYLGHMDGSAPVRLVPALSSGILARHPVSGAWYLMWVRDDDLLAQEFDLGSGKLSGDVKTIAHDVRVEDSQRLTYASASLNGHLAWATSRASEFALALYGRDGRRIRMLSVPPGKIIQPQISPDGKRLLFTRVEQGGADIFLHDLTTNAIERLTSGSEYEETPTWTPDGRAFTYLGRKGGKRTVFRRTFGSGAADEPLHEDQSPSAGFESPDRRFVIVSTFKQGGAEDVAVRLRDGTIIPLLEAPGSDTPQGLSTDGRVLMLFQSTGAKSVVSVARVRENGSSISLGPVQVVADNPLQMSLRPDGREVTVVEADGVVKSIPITTTADGLTAGAPTSLFQSPKGLQGFTVAPSGQQFVIVESPFAQGQTLRLLTRWDARLGR